MYTYTQTHVGVYLKQLTQELVIDYIVSLEVMHNFGNSWFHGPAMDILLG